MFSQKRMLRSNASNFQSNAPRVTFCTSVNNHFASFLIIIIICFPYRASTVSCVIRRTALMNLPFYAHAIKSRRNTVR